MKKQNPSRKVLFVGMLAGLFASTVLATGGNGNEPPASRSKGDSSSFCDVYPVVCSFFLSGTGGNGNEPPKN
jgi:hypothetical protein